MSKQTIFTALLLIWMSLFILTSNVTADTNINIMYHERPPYMVFDSQEMVSGLVGFPIHKAFESTGIPHTWTNIPPKRQLKYIQANKERVCGVGWFKNLEREAYARFTSPVYKDTVIAGFALANNTKLSEASDLKKVFQDKSLTLLVKQGYSYGEYIDDMIQQYNPKRYAVGVDNLKILKMLNHGRVDYLFATIEEVYELTIGNDLKMSDYKVIYFSDVTERNYRYLMCSKLVKEDEISRLNRWIDKYIGVK